jgi:hypothetical protein
MAFPATSITVTIDAVPYVLARLNPGVPYGGEFYLRNNLEERRVIIRHSEEAPAKGSLYRVQRHNLSLTHTKYATDEVPEEVVQANLILRHSKRTDLVVAEKTIKGIHSFLGGGTVIADLLNWNS